jgi:hypothetical protein
MGLEIDGESPEDVLQEVGRLFVDEFGFATEVEVASDGDVITMKVHNCANRTFTDDLVAAGVGSPFICPFMCVSDAVFDRMGEKALTKIEKWVKGNGSIITFEFI